MRTFFLTPRDAARVSKRIRAIAKARRAVSKRSRAIDRRAKAASPVAEPAEPAARVERRVLRRAFDPALDGELLALARSRREARPSSPAPICTSSLLER